MTCKEEFGKKRLRRITDYRWLHDVPNERLLGEIDSRCIACIAREHEFLPYGCVTKFPDVDLAHWVVSVTPLVNEANIS